MDKERILGKISELDNYLRELSQIKPASFEEYRKVEKLRSCERLLQLSIECLIDICNLFVSGLKLGPPAEEGDLFDKLAQNKIIPKETVLLLKELRAFRNILIHEYAAVDDHIVYEKIKTRLGDFDKIKKIFLIALKR